MTRTEYRDAVLALYTGGLDNAVDAYIAAGYTAAGETDLEFVARCAEQDYDDGAYGGAIYQELLER